MVNVPRVLRGRFRPLTAVAAVIVLVAVGAAPSARTAADDLPYLPATDMPDMMATSYGSPAPPVADTPPPSDAMVTTTSAPDPSTPQPDTPTPVPDTPTPLPDTPTTVPPTATPEPTAAPVSVGVPQRILIPSVGINAGVEIVGVESDGSLGTPQNFDNTGWYQYGPRPGEQGNAVIDGHVDSAVLNRGAVFWNLRYVKPGDDITIISDDGLTHHFTVTGTQQITPQNVPADQIFGPSDGVHLTLITCDASTPFNRKTHEYGGWVLVTADAA